MLVHTMRKYAKEATNHEGWMFYYGYIINQIEKAAKQGKWECPLSFKGCEEHPNIDQIARIRVELMEEGFNIKDNCMIHWWDTRREQ